MDNSKVLNATKNRKTTARRVKVSMLQNKTGNKISKTFSQDPVHALVRAPHLILVAIILSTEHNRPSNFGIWLALVPEDDEPRFDHIWSAFMIVELVLLLPFRCDCWSLYHRISDM